MAAEVEHFQEKVNVSEAKEQVKSEINQTNTEHQNIFNAFQHTIDRFFHNRIKNESNVREEVHVDKGVNLSEILNRLLLLQKPSDKRLPPVNPYTHIVVLARNLKAYLELLPEDEVHTLAQCVAMDVTKWLTQLFGLDSVFSLFHERNIDGLLKMCKVALYTKYTKYATDGFTALYTRPPVVYISASAPSSLAQKLRSELGFPQSSICIIPCNTMFGSPHTMDVSAFERHLTDDISCGKTPLLLIAYAGTPLSGHTDNLARLREVCTQSGVWLHIEGDILANLTMPQILPSIQVATSADSLTLNLPVWFGLPTLPLCTFYRTKTPSIAIAAGMAANRSDNLVALPLWITLQFIGTHDVKRIIEHASGLAQQMCHRLDSTNGIKRLEQPTGLSPIVIFKYKATPSLPLALHSHTDLTTPLAKVAPRGKVEVSPKLADKCNRMIMEMVERRCEKISIECANIPREGVCMRFHPLSTSRSRETSKTDVDEFVEQLQQFVVDMDHTLVTRPSLREALLRISDILYVETPDVPALGAFQCIPKYWQTKNMTNLSDIKKLEINELNAKIYEVLNGEFDSLSLETLENGQVYVKVGLVNETFDVQNFSETVLKYTLELEDNEKFVETIKDTVQKNIEEAMEKLEKEREEKFFQDGVLRNVPLVSSLYNWWSPPPQENHGVIGRSFDLSSGKLETSAQTYKLKMQVHDDQSDAGSFVSSRSLKSSSSKKPAREEPAHNSTIEEPTSVSDGEEAGELSNDEASSTTDEDIRETDIN